MVCNLCTIVCNLNGKGDLCMACGCVEFLRNVTGRAPMTQLTLSQSDPIRQMATLGSPFCAILRFFRFTNVRVIVIGRATTGLVCFL